MTNKYKVFVDDNYHYGDEGERYETASYKSLQEAINQCEEITIKSLTDLYEHGITADDLKAQWSMFGEDPFIRGADISVPFSARKFISTEICQIIIEAKESK